MIKQLKRELSQIMEENSQLTEENSQLTEENSQLKEVQVQDMKGMEEKLQNLLESYGERSRYIHSWSK